MPPRILRTHLLMAYLFPMKKATTTSTSMIAVLSTLTTTSTSTTTSTPNMTDLAFDRSPAATTKQITITTMTLWIQTTSRFLSTYSTRASATAASTTTNETFVTLAGPRTYTSSDSAATVSPKLTSLSSACYAPAFSLDMMMTGLTPMPSCGMLTRQPQVPAIP